MGCSYCGAAYSAHVVNGVWHCEKCCRRAYSLTHESTPACGIKEVAGKCIWLSWPGNIEEASK